MNYEVVIMIIINNHALPTFYSKFFGTNDVTHRHLPLPATLIIIVIVENENAYFLYPITCVQCIQVGLYTSTSRPVLL